MSFLVLALGIQNSGLNDLCSQLVKPALCVRSVDKPKFAFINIKLHNSLVDLVEAEKCD